MLASDALAEKLNQQVGNEMGASMQYISIAAYFDGQSLTGLSRFFYAQAEEERDHAMRLVRFLVDSGQELRIPDIPAARTGFGSAEEAVGLALAWEKEVTQQIYDLVGPICETGDFLGKDRCLALKANDLLAIRSSGAYGFTMSSNYNSRPRCPEILVDGDNAYLVRERETQDSLMQGEHIPEMD